MSGIALKVDHHGHLADAEAWSEEIASSFAEAARIELSTDHWHVLAVVRAFHEDTGVAPSMRPLVKLVRERVGRELGTSIALMRLFPPDRMRGGSARLVAQIAGLPVPENCL